MAAFSKTQGAAVLTHQAVTHPATVKGLAQDVSTKIAATIICFHASVEAVANTNPGSFHIQVSGSSSGNEDWATIMKFTAQATTAATEALTATEPSGETSLAVASTTGFTAEDLVYIQDAGTLADSEWGLVQEITGTPTIVLVDGLTTGKDASDFIWDQAEIFPVNLNLSAVGRVRVIFQHEGATGANCHVKALMITGDSFA